MSCKEVDYLIIGQGLAGSLMSFKLISSGASVMVFDAGHRGSASKVAAGIINPITGHRWNLTNNFYDFLKVATSFYAVVEDELKCDLLTPMKQSRLIKNQGQSDYFEKRLKQADYDGLLKASKKSLLKNTGYDFAEVSHSYHFDTQGLLLEVSNWLNEHASLTTEAFNYTGLETHNNGVNYQNHKKDFFSARKIIFCEGYQAIHNPWLHKLPFKLAKGSVLEVTAKTTKVESSNSDQPSILNWGHWLMTDKNNKARLGSSYEWNDLGTKASIENEQTLLASLHKHSDIEGRVVSHKTGIRPTTKHRQPFVGELSNLKHAYCFNGLGSKGCLLAPYYVDMLFQHFTNGTAIPAELEQWL